MDDLLALMDGVGDDGGVPDRGTALTQNTGNVPDEPNLNPRGKSSNDEDRTEPQSSENNSMISVDGKIGIRISKRLISSIDLLDLLSENTFHSTAALSAMSRAARNRILVEPATIESDATVCGKTNLVTVGIVFSNTGTKISSNGRAFSILVIGNLNTGPVATVFLFGNAYSRLCTKCPPGSVIALVMPNLVPPRTDGKSTDTSISLSVNDERQLLRVGTARDYAVCKGMVNKKRGDGKWVSNGAPCKNFVDRRVSEYCVTHRKQPVRKDGKGNVGVTAFQKLRSDHQAATNSGIARGSFDGRTQSQLIRAMTMSTPAGTVVTHVAGGGTQSTQGVARSMSKGTRLDAPLHMKRAHHGLHVQHSSNHQILDGTRMRPAASNLANPYSQTGRPALSQLQNKSRPPLVHGSKQRATENNWLIKEKRKNTMGGGSVVKKNKRSINVDTDAYNGSVPIPKPSKLFKSTNATHDSRLRSTMSIHQTVGPDKRLEGAIREKQRSIAQLVQSRGQSASVRSAPSGLGQRKKISNGPKHGSSETSLKDSLFGRFDKVDTERINSAKSRFASEADAEEYAKSRRAVTELERREEQKAAKERGSRINGGVSSTSPNVKESAIQKEWICLTCQRRSTIDPKTCRLARHKIRLNRAVKRTTTVTDQRLKLQDKSVSDGGLTLGSGLEWRR